jgi:nitric oxide reductase large subunit
MAVGASFSALEVVPLVVIGFEAYNKHTNGKDSIAWHSSPD